jgi:GTP-binding protein
MPLFHKAEFILAVHDVAQLPPERGIEVAFAGRSNAGKSSAINAIVGRRRLAFVSKTPGRTQTINYFSLGPDRFFADLPGYGYAAVPNEEKRNWAMLISTYLRSRQSLRGLIVVMDARRAFTTLDRQMLSWIAPLGKASHVLLTKADKLVRRDAITALAEAKSAANQFPDCTVQLFSATTRQGADEARGVISEWLRYSSGP